MAVSAARQRISKAHARIFNKKSLERWGTRSRPGLTLNLTPMTARAPAAALRSQFDDAARPDIEAYLCARETCAATEVPITLPDGDRSRGAHLHL